MGARHLNTNDERSQQAARPHSSGDPDREPAGGVAASGDSAAPGRDGVPEQVGPSVANHLRPDPRTSDAEEERRLWEAAFAAAEGERDQADDTIGLFAGTGVTDAQRYGLSRRRRYARLMQIFKIVRTYDVFGGITPVKFRRMLEELGPTFVKTGQILSMRSEILPERFCTELAKLRADVDPMPYDTVRAVLERELSRPLGEVFESVDPKPLGSASVAQVHRARLRSGEDVAVKVQRPYVQELMAQDIDIMRSLVRRLSRFMKGDQFLDLRSVVEELWESFRQETDFLVEAKNLSEFRMNNEGCRFVACPAPYPALCTEHVVVMDYVEGIPISATARLVEAGYDLTEIGTKLVDNYSSQLLDDGFFHADPHPGNIVVSGGKIVYLDLGIVGRLSGSMRVIMRDIIFSVAEHDTPKLKGALLRLSTSSPDEVDHAELLADLDEVVDEFGSVALAELDLGKLLGDIIALARRCGLELPGQVTSMARGLVTLEGVLDEFLPGVNMVDIISRHIRSHTDVSQALRHDFQELGMRGRAATKGMLGAASQAELAMSMLTRGQLKFNMDFVGSEDPIEDLSHIADRLTMGVLCVGFLIAASAIVMAMGDGYEGPMLVGVPAFAFVLYVIAFALAAVVVRDLWSRGRRKRR